MRAPIPYPLHRPLVDKASANLPSVLDFQEIEADFEELEALDAEFFALLEELKSSVVLYEMLYGSRLFAHNMTASQALPL